MRREARGSAAERASRRGGAAFGVVMRRVRRPAALVVCLSLAACSGDGDDAMAPATTTTTTTTPTTTASATDATTTTTEAGPRLGQSCTHEERGVTIEVRYPDGWHSDDGDAAVACSAFDPDPFQLRRGTEYPPDLAVVVSVEPLPFERASQASSDRVEDAQRAEVAGRQAVRLEVVSTGEGLRPAGERSVRWVIDGGAERSIIAQTSDVEGNDFPHSRRVLDAMVRAFTIRAGQLEQRGQSPRTVSGT